MAHTVSATSNSEMALNLVRKSNKPLMEKRRRARINSSLNQLKSLVLEAMKKDTSRYSKLEKADILEMTVKHLKTVQRQQMSVAMASDSTVAGKYRAGFTECAKEVTRYLTSIDGIRTETRDRLLSHLANCMHAVNSGATAPSSGIYRQQVSDTLTQPIQVQIPSATAVPALPGAQAQMHTGCTSGSSSAVYSPQETKLAGAFQLVPGTLSTGTVAFFVTPQQTATPVYVSPQMDKPVSTSTGNQYKLKAPSPMLGMEAPEFAPQHQPVHDSRTTSPAMLMIRSPVLPSSDDRKEQVWRPW